MIAKYFFLSSLCLFGYSYLNPRSPSALSEYTFMDQLAVEAGTAKSSLYHDYMRVYSKYFASLRNQPIKFLEIGILHGQSVQFWERYFPKGTLHFIDSSFDRIDYFSTRSTYHLADQANALDLRKVMKDSGGDFNIIIDDGGHVANQQITSFLELFPHVKSGGMYIIEDLHTSYWKNYGGSDAGSAESPIPGEKSAITFLQGLIHDLNFVGARTGIADHRKLSPELKASLSYTKAHIDSMHFYDSLCIILKK
ncbi:MAG: class I SAM-dependent methyltransferase [Chlamydiota bacterium]